MSNLKKNIVCLITARKNSKRLKHKNIKILGRKPLIKWTIDFSKEIKWVKETWVSTDDPEVKKIIKKEKNIFLHLRPKNLAKDNSSSINVMIDFLKWYRKNYLKKIDGLLLLQPTSPFRSIKVFKKGFQLFCKKKINVIGFSNFNFKKKFFFIEKNKKYLKKLYIISGSFYLLEPKYLLKYKNIFKPDFMPLIDSNPNNNIDIDDKEDFKKATNFLKKKNYE